MLGLILFLGQESLDVRVRVEERRLGALVGQEEGEGEEAEESKERGHEKEGEAEVVERQQDRKIESDAYLPLFHVRLEGRTWRLERRRHRVGRRGSVRHIGRVSRAEAALAL